MSKSTPIDLDTLELPSEIEQLADAPAFSSSERLAQAGRIMMARHVRKLYAHLPGVLRGDDPHDVHQMRVATRRLRASLAATAPAYRAKLVERLGQQLRKLARVLGEVRDRDVLLLRLRHDASQRDMEQPHELTAVIERLQQERDKAHGALLKQLQRKQTRRLLHDLNDFLTLPLAEVQAADDGLPLLVHHHAGSAVWQHYEAVWRFESIMPHASSERLHELRIACKHLRYTLELFAPALGAETDSLLKQVTAMQEHLGDLHDADVALTYFDAQSAPDDAADSTPDEQLNDGTTSALEPAGDSISYRETRHAERQSLLAGVTPLWQQLSGTTSRRKLAKLLAAL